MASKQKKIPKSAKMPLIPLFFSHPVFVLNSLQTIHQLFIKIHKKNQSKNIIFLLLISTIEVVSGYLFLGQIRLQSTLTLIRNHIAIRFKDQPKTKECNPQKN